jgi:hypothetical protein
MGIWNDGSWNLKARERERGKSSVGWERRGGSRGTEGVGEQVRLIVCNLDFEIRNTSALVSRNMSFAGSFFGGFWCFCLWVAVGAKKKGLTKNKTPFLRAFLFWRSICS